MFLERHAAVLRYEQRRAIKDLAACRTAALGGHAEDCDACGLRRFAYNSCRNRHCPKCQASARARWLEARSAELLDVPYFHVVFTLPAEFGPLALQNKCVIYGLLFQAASETLRQIAAQPKHLGAEIGFLAVLHTWGQNMMHHPHLHCVVPAGGLSPDGQSWIASSDRFFLPVRVLSRVFRGKFVGLLKRAHEQGRLAFSGSLLALADRAIFEQLIDRAVRSDWVVYAKPPFGSPKQVLKYLARYTHRVAISNSRIVAFDGQRVSFYWKDYADGNRQKTMTLGADEFVRRFLMHVRPKGFASIRYYGFLANRHRQQKLGTIRQLLGAGSPTAASETAPQALPASGETASDELCPSCRVGRLHKTAALAPQAPPSLHWLLPPSREHSKVKPCDTS